MLLSIKNLMRFYFSAGSLNAALDRLILRLGLAAGNDYLAGCAAYAERAAKVVEAKGRLAELWARLDGVICGLTERDRLALKKYAAMRGGADGEEDASLRARVLESFKRLPNGANSAFYQQGALSFEQVVAAAVIPRPRGVGSVDVVPATLAGLPNGELLEELEDYFEARREIAVDLKVRAPETVAVNIAVAIEPEEGRGREEVLAGVEREIRDWFTGRLLGQNILLARLGDLVYHCDGVSNYAIAAPGADVEIREDQLPVLGTLSVEEKG